MIGVYNVTCRRDDNNYTTIHRRAMFLREVKTTRSTDKTRSITRQHRGSRLSALRPLEWARESGLAQCSHTDTDRDVGKTSDDPLPKSGNHD